MMKVLQGAFLGAFAWLACGLAPARAQDADPAKWGVYAKLPGVERQAGPDGYRLRWRWVKPNEELAEEYIVPRTGLVASTNTITLGARPGTLVVTGTFGAGTKTWNGTVLPDGSVDFIVQGILATPYRAVLLEDGSFEMRRLKLDKGVVASVKPAKARDHYSPVDGASATPVVAAAPIASPASSVATSVPVVSPTPPAAAPASTIVAPVRDFGFLERHVGHQLVSDKYTLDIYREGNGLAFHMGDAGGYRTRRWVVTLAGATGTYLLTETTFPTPVKSRLAYFDESGALYLEYSDESYRYMNRFSASDDSVLVETRIAERRRFGGYGAYDAWIPHRYGPATEDALRLAAMRNAEQKQAEQREEQEARERKRERDEQWANNMNALNQGLQNALADATASEQQSRAALDATLQRAAEQAAYERGLAAQREQAQANASAAEDVRRAREATERQYEIARQFEAQQQAQRLAQQQPQQEAQRVAASNPAAQPARQTAATAGNSSSTPSCPKVYKSGIGASGFANTQAEAERWARRDMELQCPMASYSAGTMQCSQKKQGDVVSIDSKGHSTKTGEMTAWMCQAEYRCTQPSDQCARGPAQGSAQ